MDSIVAFLSAFGPWGVVAGVVVMVGYRFWLSRGGPALPPIQIPKPDAPQPESDRFPVLSKIIHLFGVKSVADMAPEAIDAITVELEDLIGQKHADLSAALEVARKLLDKKLPQAPAAPVIPASQAVKLS